MLKPGLESSVIPPSMSLGLVIARIHLFLIAFLYCFQWINNFLVLNSDLPTLNLNIRYFLIILWPIPGLYCALLCAELVELILDVITSHLTTILSRYTNINNLTNTLSLFTKGTIMVVVIQRRSTIKRVSGKFAGFKGALKQNRYIPF